MRYLFTFPYVSKTTLKWNRKWHQNVNMCKTMISLNMFKYQLNTLNCLRTFWCKVMIMHVYLCTLIIIYIHNLLLYHHVPMFYILRNCCAPCLCPCILDWKHYQVVFFSTLVSKKLSWHNFLWSMLEREKYCWGSWLRSSRGRRVIAEEVDDEKTKEAAARK